MNEDLSKIGNRATPIDAGILEQNLIEAGMSGRVAQWIKRNQDFQKLKCRNHQVVFLYKYYRDCYPGSEIIHILAKVFEVSENPIRRAIAAGFNEILQPGVNPTLNEDDEQHIIDIILTEEQQGNSMRPKEVVAYTNEQYKLHLTKGLLQTFLIRNREKTERADSYPVNSKRFNVPRIYFTNHFS
ncbi:hypothetical protein M9Y10_005242 [Tritrichomonas musculus]|uniref:Uncharacterized protein n=1 Tax=Tritrichomonas musculus TaxID=1915356 RepID=A0ABR2JKW9_9EUKA